MKNLDNIQNYFEKITYRMLKENNYPELFKVIFKYGIKNIFVLQNGSQHGLTSNTYYNNKTGKIFREYYLPDTNFPADFSFEDNMLTFNEALDMGLVNDIMILEGVKSRKISKFMEMDDLPNFSFLNVRYDNVFPLKVTVNGGRKFRGEGYIIDAYEVSSNYGSSYVAEIYDPKNNTINECTLNYVEFPKSVLEQYKNYCLNIINSCTFNDIDLTDLTIKDNIINKLSFMNFVKSELGENIDYSSARNLIKEKVEAKRKEKEEKNKAFKEAKMKDLIEWVKKNTDKEGEEIEKLAERIYKKRYEY